VTSRQIFLVFFALCFLIGVPVVMATGMPLLFGVVALLIAAVLWGRNKLVSKQHG
jgi:hypothetical protein